MLEIYILGYILAGFRASGPENTQKAYLFWPGPEPQAWKCRQFTSWGIFWQVPSEAKEGGVQPATDELAYSHAASEGSLRGLGGRKYDTSTLSLI